MNETIQRREEVITAPLDDLLLMMSVERGQYFSLNQVAARIWELLEQPTTPTALVQQLVEEFEVTPEECAPQVTTFLDQLRQRGLLHDGV